MVAAGIITSMVTLGTGALAVSSSRRRFPLLGPEPAQHPPSNLWWHFLVQRHHLVPMTMPEQFPAAARAEPMALGPVF